MVAGNVQRALEAQARSDLREEIRDQRMAAVKEAETTVAEIRKEHKRACKQVGGGDGDEGQDGDGDDGVGRDGGGEDEGAALMICGEGGVDDDCAARAGCSPPLRGGLMGLQG